MKLLDKVKKTGDHAAIITHIPTHGGMTMDVYDQMAAKWKSAAVARLKAGEFSGGILHPRSLANLDAKGEGPPKYRMGKIVFYPVDELVKWMRRRAESLQGDEER